MKINEFAKEVAVVMQPIHIYMIKRQPSALMKGKVTFPQMVIIGILHAKKECKMSDVSKILKVTKSAVTGLTDRLIKAGLLKRARSKRDRRVVKIRLTPKGASTARRLNNFTLKVIGGLFSNISQKERAQYLMILRKLQKNIEAKKRI